MLGSAGTLPCSLRAQEGTSHPHKATGWVGHNWLTTTTPYTPTAALPAQAEPMCGVGPSPHLTRLSGQTKRTRSPRLQYAQCPRGNPHACGYRSHPQSPCRVKTHRQTRPKRSPARLHAPPEGVNLRNPAVRSEPPAPLGGKDSELRGLQTLEDAPCLRTQKGFLTGNTQDLDTQEPQTPEQMPSGPVRAEGG